MLIPAFGLGTAAAKRAVSAYQEAFQDGLSSTAQALALATDREIDAYRATMATLAGSSTLDGPAPDLAAFEVEARRASAALSTTVLLLDATTMRQIVNTALPPGIPSGRISAGDFRSVAETGEPLITNLVIGAVAQRPVIGVAVPVKRDGHIPFVLAARLPPERVARLLEEQRSGGHGFSVVVDARQQVVARSREHDRYVGRMAPDWFVAGTADRASGFLEGISVSGQDIVLGFARLSSVPGWTVGRVEMRSDYLASWRQPLEILAWGGGLIVLFGTVLAICLSRRLIRPVTALVGAAQVLGGGDAAQRLPASASGVTEFEALRRGLLAADDALRARDRAKRQADERQALLMREVDHRAKNALAVALSLAQLAPRNVPPDQFAAVLVGRIAAMARAHSLLSQAAWSGSDVRTLAEGELAPYAGRVALSGPVINLIAEAVQPMAMLLHEIGHECRQARRPLLPGRPGKPRLALHRSGLRDAVRVDGVRRATPGGRAAASAPGSSPQLAERQLGGTIAFDWQPGGLRVTFTLPPNKGSEGFGDAAGRGATGAAARHAVGRLEAVLGP
ncbi:HWE histidine kinase domain-containing protein [Dankookia sp. P2]|uniref:HWE histidine kinase domain-containing protein n=1 Tax=Dankookia sp. P2 TaxID=3423955 RepID=UPI003D67C49D